MSHQYTNCYIAFLDILGFKKMIDEKTCEEIHNLYSNEMKKPLAKISTGTKEFNMDNLNMKVMSDSICFFVDSSIRNSLYGLISNCVSFQSQLLRLKEPVLSRGAIVKGNIYANGDIIFGPGFVKAYQMEENNAKYPRIIMTQETFQFALENTDEEFKESLYSNIFCDFDEFISIDTLDSFEGFDTYGEQCKHLLNYINRILASTIDSSIREKFLYLKKNLLRWYKIDNSSN